MMTEAAFSIWSHQDSEVNIYSWYDCTHRNRLIQFKLTVSNFAINAAGHRDGSFRVKIILNKNEVANRLQLIKSFTHTCVVPCKSICCVTMTFIHSEINAI